MQLDRLDALLLVVADVLLDAADEAGAVVGGPRERLEVAKCLVRPAAGVEVRPQQLGVAEDRREQVVEVVGDAHRHPAEHLEAPAARLLGRPRGRLAERLADEHHREAPRLDARQPRGLEVEQHRYWIVRPLAVHEEHLVRDGSAARGLDHVVAREAGVVEREAAPERVRAEEVEPGVVGVEALAGRGDEGGEELGRDERERCVHAGKGTGRARSGVSASLRA